MSEQWSDLGSEVPSESTKNGREPNSAAAVETVDDAPGAVATVADPEGALQEATHGASADSADAAGSAAAVTEGNPFEAEGSEEAPVAAVADSTADDPDSTFLADLARAMQATAASERARMDVEIEKRRGAHIDQIRARQASEADRMRELAAEELQAIDVWAKGERDRIRLERERRAGELDADLATSLADHTKQVDAEIELVETAISTYRTDVEAFFADLDQETDVVAIAQRATLRPAFPDLERVVSGTVSVDAVTEPAVEAPLEQVADAAADAGTSAEPSPVGVMDPASIGEPGESWTAVTEATSAAQATGEPADDDAEPLLIDDDVVPVAAGVNESGRKSLFQSVQVVHPTSWLHRSKNGDDGPASRD